VRRCTGRNIPEGKTPMGKHPVKGEQKCSQMPHATSTEDRIRLGRAGNIGLLAYFN